MMRFPRAAIVLAATIAAFTATSAEAHEFWLEAEDYTIAAGAAIRADLRVGQEFRGNRLVFDPSRFRRFEIVGPDGALPVDSRLGDRPAVDQTVAAPGAHIVVHVTTDTVLTYDTLEDFAAFAGMHGLEDRVAEHRARGLPEAEFREVYSRSVKALIQAGPNDAAQVRDAALGLPIELVVEGDPYADPTPDSLGVVARLGGAPMSDVVVTVFAKDAEDAVSRFDVRTDAQGRAVVPLERERRYLLNTVHLRQPEAALADETGAVWESLWASVTFETD